jgi:hypothetical protein
MCKISTAQQFWRVYSHLKHPSSLPTVSDYHFFKDGIRPVWEDEENKSGGKWIIRLKKGVSDRYWEDLLMAMIGDQFAEAAEEVCGAVLSVRSGEDVFSIWTKNDGGRNIKIRFVPGDSATGEGFKLTGRQRDGQARARAACRHEHCLEEPRRQHRTAHSIGSSTAG